jgi:hypothetical protein
MIKTLRITGVAVVLLAGVVLASVLVPTSVFHLGARGNKQFSRILNEPNAVDRFRSQHGSEDQGNRDTTPPLVRQAEILAKIINPAPTAAPTPPRPTPRAPGDPSLGPKTPSAKFEVVGTAYSPSRPSASFAYLRMADKTYQWVQQGEQVAHYVIKKITGDSITCWDGSRDVEMPVETVPDTADVLTGGSASAGSAASALPQPTGGTAPVRPVVHPVIPNAPVAAGRIPAPATPAAGGPPLQLTPQEEEVLGSMVERLRQTEGDSTEREAAIRKIIEEYRSSRITAGETEKLGNLGEELNDQNAAREAQRRESLRRLSIPRSTKR